MNLDLMRRIDEQFLETPFYGSRQMRLHLQHQDIVVGRGRVRRLMRRMGLMAIYQGETQHSCHRVGEGYTRIVPLWPAFGSTKQAPPEAAFWGWILTPGR